MKPLKTLLFLITCSCVMQAQNIPFSNAPTGHEGIKKVCIDGHTYYVIHSNGVTMIPKLFYVNTKYKNTPTKIYHESCK